MSAVGNGISTLKTPSFRSVPIPRGIESGSLKRAKKAGESEAVDVCEAVVVVAFVVEAACVMIF